jgi:lipopolysaccharide biosynthesis glycosyltransferase
LQIVFTICSNNYLAQAKTLGDSLLSSNPDVKFIIGLCDGYIGELDYSRTIGYEIIPFQELGLADFDGLVNKYNIVELNTSIKPSFFKYLLKRYKYCEKIIYLDPDIAVFSSIGNLWNHLDSYDIVITPHILNPPPIDGLEPGENLFMMYGIFNLGFLALNGRAPQSASFLDWWESRTLELGKSDIENGFYVDQLWINMAPVYFDKVLILKNLGYNVAPWNLHEREIVADESGGYRMQDGSDLVFFHFSSFNYRITHRLAKFFNRYTYQNASNAVKKIYVEYREKMILNGVDKFSSIDYKYGKRPIILPPPPSRWKQTLLLFFPPILLISYYHTKKCLLRGKF